MDSSVFSTPKTKRNVKNNGNRTQAVVVGGDIESELIEEGGLSAEEGEDVIGILALENTFLWNCPLKTGSM